MAKGKKAKKETPRQAQGRTAYAAFFTGLFLCGASIFMVLSFLTADITLDPINGGNYCSTGLIGSWLAYGSILSFGKIASFFLALLVFFWGSLVMKKGRFFGTWVNVLGGVLMLFAVSLFSGLMGSGDFYSGGLLSEIVLPYANLYGGGLGVFMMSTVIFVTGMVLACGTRVFSAAEWLGESLVHMFISTLRTSVKVCKGGKEVFSPKLKRAMLTAGAGVAAPVRGARKAAKERMNQRAERVESEILTPETEDSEEDSGFDIEAAVVDDAKVESEPRSMKERVIINREISVSEAAADSSMDPVVDIIADGDVSAPSAVDFRAESDEASAEFSPEEEISSDNYGMDIADRDTADYDEEFEPQEESEELLNAADDEVGTDNPYARLAEQEALKKARVEAEQRKQAEREAAASAEKAHPYELPPLDLLDPVPEHKGGNPAALAKRAKILENLLTDFKIQGQVVHIERGPRITQFEVSLAPGIKLSRVCGLQDNIAMVLKAPSIRIIAPIPGKDTIGIEIPNIDQELVTLREVVEAVNIQKRKQALPLCLAKDVSGKPIVADLAKMPHLLIAGATGSGKSVCINSIIMSFLTCLRYDECKLIMVDPKVVELSRFRDIPHLMSPVITDMQKAVGVLEWACQEMDQRYEKLSMVSVNNLAKFNALSEAEMERRVSTVYGEEELEHFPRKLPYIVIIIDELADLMMVAKKDVENHIARLAAKSRAVGIHLILATQRPSTDVITGLIKANMPARIAFQVASKIDSRIILDQMGAESLLGQGDMLYLPPGVSKVMRSQGVFVSDEELFRVVGHCKEQKNPEYHTALEGPVIGGNAGETDITDYDEYFLEAAERIIESQRGSVSLLQRKLGIGYGRASRIVDQLAEAGILGPFREGKAREILIDMDEFYARYFGGGSNLGQGKYRQEQEGSIAGLREDERAPF